MNVFVSLAAFSFNVHGAFEGLLEAIEKMLAVGFLPIKQICVAHPVNPVIPHFRLDWHPGHWPPPPAWIVDPQTIFRPQTCPCRLMSRQHVCSFCFEEESRGSRSQFLVTRLAVLRVKY